MSDLFALIPAGHGEGCSEPEIKKARCGEPSTRLEKLQAAELFLPEFVVMVNHAVDFIHIAA